MVRLHRRRRLARRAGLSLVLICGLLAQVRASDWPAFRGTDGQGRSDEVGLPLVWSESRNVAWKSAVSGRGWSSPVVAGGRVWLTTAVESRGGASLRLQAYDEQRGIRLLDREVFRLPDAELLNQKNSLASPTPIVDGNRVYVHFGLEGTAAVSLAGEVLWTAQYACDTQHGSGGSPVLYRDLLIFSCDGFTDAYVVALETQSGRQRWKTARRRPVSQAYTTPLVIRVGERDQVVSAGAYRTVAYDPTTGAEIWRVGYGAGFSNVPRPVFGHGLVFLATGFQEPAMMAVRADGAGDVTATHVAWTVSRGAPLTPSPILAGDQLYYVSDTGVATCVDAATGRVRWQQRLGGNYSASPVYADGRLYFQSEEGMTTVVAPGPVFRRLAENELAGMTLASMAVSGGAFFLRTDTHLYRIAEGR